MWGGLFIHTHLLLDVLDGVARLDVERDGLSGEGFHEDLHGCETRATLF